MDTLKANFCEGVPTGARCAVRVAARRTAILASVAAALLSGPALQADELTYDLRAGVGQSDNIARTETDTISETILGLGLGLDYAHDGNRVDASLVGDLEYYEYQDNTYDGNVLGNAIGNLTIGLVPEKFLWVFDDNFGQAQTDPFVPITPDTRENVNVFRTGPDLNIRLGSQNALRLLGRWGDTYYQKTPYDNQLWLGGAAFAHTLSQGSTLSFNASTSSVTYDDNSTGGDFDIQEYYGAYESAGARTRILAELGYRSLHQYDQTSGGVHLLVNVERDLSSSSSIRLRLGSDYGDTGMQLVDLAGAGPPQAVDSPLVSSSTVAQEDYAELVWNLSRQRTTLSLEAGYHDLSYKQQEILNNDYVTLFGSVTRRVRESVDVGANLRWYDYTYDQPGSDYQQLEAEAFARWRPGSAFYTDLQVRYFDRSGATPYNETQWWLWLGYAPERH
jgi:hypothetical protein